jgi:micrococcal nuclease
LNFNSLIILITILRTFDVCAKDKNYGTAIVSEITNIYDGDTFRANIEGYPAIVGEHMSIRINGIDKPELRGKCDKEKQVEYLRTAKSITLKSIKRGEFFRLIANVYIDGISLGELLIKYKHAVRYKGKGKKAVFPAVSHSL